MNPQEHGPIVLEVFCGRRPDPHRLGEVRLRPSDGHRVLHPTWRRVSEDFRAVLDGDQVVDLDDEQRVPQMSQNIGRMVQVSTDEGRQAAARLAAIVGEQTWLLCACGPNRSVTAEWLREHAPKQLQRRPRRVGAP